MPAGRGKNAADLHEHDVAERACDLGEAHVASELLARKEHVHKAHFDAEAGSLADAEQKATCKDGIQVIDEERCHAHNDHKRRCGKQDGAVAHLGAGDKPDQDGHRDVHE